MEFTIFLQQGIILNIHIESRLTFPNMYVSGTEFSIVNFPKINLEILSQEMIWVNSILFMQVK